MNGIIDVTNNNLLTDPKIIDAVKELEYWIRDNNTPMPNHIARINKQHLDLLFDKYDDGEGIFVIDQWVRLGTRQEL